jgi:preprotein translocase subunit SecG
MFVYLAPAAGGLETEATFMNPLAAITWAQIVVTALFVVICVLLILVILIQKGRGGGLSSAFGGAGGYSAFGAKTGDVFTWITVALTFLFILMAVIGNYMFVPPPVTTLPPPEAVAPGTAIPETPAEAPTPAPQ